MLHESLLLLEFSEDVLMSVRRFKLSTPLENAPHLGCCTDLRQAQRERAHDQECIGKNSQHSYTSLVPPAER